MFDRLKWETFACIQNKDELFSMYISCIKDASVALKLPLSEGDTMWNIRDGRRPSQHPHFTFQPLPTTHQALYFLSTYRLCLLRITRGLQILCVLSLLVWFMNLIIDSPPNSHEVSGTSYVSQQHDICDVNLFTNRNTDTVSHYWNTAHGQLRPI